MNQENKDNTANRIQLWSHRGYTGFGARENTVTSLSDAIKAGYKSIEFDIWYFQDFGLRIKHDEPSTEEIPNLPTLNDYFQHGNQLKYWLDWKNLSEENIDEVLKEFAKVIDKNNIQQENLYFTPCENNLQKGLEFCRKAQLLFPEINLMLFVEDLPEQGAGYLYQFLKDNNIANLSIDYKNIDGEFVKLFHDINIFVWTVDKVEDMEKLAKMGIKNICSNAIKPIN